MKIVIIGGHLSPALAVIERLPKDTEILFIGRKHTFEGDTAYSLEYNTIKSLDIPFVSISTGRLQRRFTRYTIPSFLKIPYGFVQSFFILRKFKPDVVLGFGGYVSLPVILCAYILRIPIVIHEQTLEAGLANKALSFFASRICVSWETSRKFFPKEKTVLTGNPVRRFKIYDLRFMIFKEDERLPIVYITGGSSGANFINVMIEGCLRELLEEYTIIHQTGDSEEYQDFDRLCDLRNSLEPKFRNRYIVKKFVDEKELAVIYKKANLVISRAGMNTVTELIYFAKPAIFIPIQFSQNNEQLKNALFFKSLGLGEVLEQKDLTPDIFLQKVREMVHNIEKYTKNRDKIDGLIIENSAEKIVKVVEYAKKKKKEKAVS